MKPTSNELKKISKITILHHNISTMNITNFVGFIMMLNK